MLATLFFSFDFFFCSAFGSEGFADSLLLLALAS